MNTLTFAEMLRSEVARMQAAHPERLGQVARAHALIAQAMVEPSPDDPDTAYVLASDLETRYTVNGSCDCQAGAHGKPCKHVDAWRLYQHIAKKVAAQSPPVETETVLQPLPEAPSSANVRLQIQGYEVQVTLRDHSEEALLVRLEQLLTRYPKPQPRSPAPELSPQQHNAAAMHKRVSDFCPVHNVSMQRHENAKGVWYSHYYEGKHCKGR